MGPDCGTLCEEEKRSTRIERPDSAQDRRPQLIYKDDRDRINERGGSPDREPPQETTRR